MPDMTYKILLFMKRRPSLSMEAFKAYYEGTHAPMAERYSKRVARYIRRYVTPQTHPETGPGALPFDVVTELWFDDETTYRGTLDYITSALMPDEIIEDEKNLFDRSSFRIATVVECETVFQR